MKLSELLAQEQGVTIPNQQVKESIKRTGIVNGTLAKSWAPTVKQPPKTLSQLLENSHEGVPIASLEEVEVFNKAPKTLSELIEGDTKISTLVGGTKTGEALFSRFGEVGKTALTALSIDEHLIVGGIYKAMGAKPKQDISDYNWGNFLKEQLHMPDTIGTTSLGVVMSIALSPSTYLTGGAAVGGRVGFKTLLSKKGVKLVDNIVKEEVEKKSAKMMNEVKRILTPEETSKLAIETRKNVEQQVLKKFGEINDLNKGRKVSKSVEALPESVKVSGKFRLEAPQILGGGHFDIGDIMYQGAALLKGETIAKNLADSGFIRSSEKMMELSQKFNKAIDGFKTNLDQSALGELGRDVNKFFNTDANVDPKLVEVILRHGPNTAETMARSTQLTVKQSAKLETSLIKAKYVSQEELFNQTTRIQQQQIARFFNKRLNKDEQKEFMNVMIDASERSRVLKQEVLEDTRFGVVKLSPESVLASAKKRMGDVKSSNPKVQEVLDFWIGQGKFKGRKSAMDKMADKAQALVGDRLPIHIPGILEGIADNTLKLPTKIGSKAEREFLVERLGDPEIVAKYTRDPIKALSYRAAEITRANMQDDIYRNVVDKKLGGLTDEFNVPGGHLEAAKKGFVALRHPMNEHMKNIGMEGRFKETTKWVKKEFYDEYKKTIGMADSRIPLISPFLNLIEPVTMAWKRNVTVNYPSFHAGNFISNIFLNSMNIGAHAVDPNKWFRAARMMSYGKKLAAGNLEDDIYKMAATQLQGKHSFTTKNAVGEVLSDESLYKEAMDAGVIGDGFFKKDVLGLHTDGGAAKNLALGLSRFNPFAANSVYTKIGGNIGQAIETHARLINYQTWRMKGLSPRLAKLETDNALFNYGDLTGTEKLLNNSLIPFYTFSKKNYSMHLKLMNAKPGIPIAVTKMYRDLGPDENDVNGMFDWQKRRLSLKISNVIYSNFKMPMDDVMEISGMNFMNRLGPVFKYGVEKFVLDKEIFTGRPLAEANNADEFRGAWELARSKNPVLRSLGRSISDFLDLKEDPSRPEKLIGNPDILHISRNFVSSRMQSEVARLQKEDKDGFEKTIRFMTGIIKFSPQEQEEVVRSINLRDIQLELIKAFQKKRGAKTLPPIISNKYLNKEFKQYNKFLESSFNAYELEQEKKSILKELDDISEEEGR